ncbi:hypothetical protein JCM9492_07190 [Aquifex pyrophilus]
MHVTRTGINYLLNNFRSIFKSYKVFIQIFILIIVSCYHKGDMKFCENKLSSSVKLKLKEVKSLKERIKVLIYAKENGKEKFKFKAEKKIKLKDSYMIIANLSPEEILALSCEEDVIYITTPQRLHPLEK